MKKMVYTLVIGVMIGSVATYNLKPEARRTALLTVSERNIQQIPDISVAEAQVHRNERYASIRTIEDTLALPTDFAETEALYVIAGRSDSSELQDLIYQASRISDRHDRRAALGILLSRLTELDPYSAVAIARDPTFGDNSNYEALVWTTWGRLDLGNALAAALDGTLAQKSVSAQALYASVRDHDNEKMELIRSTLRVDPGRSARAEQIYSIADQSPADAIRFIESQGTQAEQHEQMGWLARYLSRSGGRSDYGDLIQSSGNRMIFEQTLAAYGVQADPEAALEKYLAEPGSQHHQSQMYVALQSLAQQDADKALTFLDQIPDAALRQNMMSVVASAMAASDPQRALAWARSNDQSTGQSTLVSVIGQIAQHDPQLALTEAQSIQNIAGRQQAVGMILLVTAQNNPSEAAEMLTLVSDQSVRKSIVGQLGQQWAARDLEGAVRWVSSLNAEDQRRALQGMGQQLINADVDRAVALLNQFPASGPPSLKLQIVQKLAQSRSIEAAQEFVSKYEGTDEYPRLQMAVISNLANTDPDRAMQMAATVQDERLKDQLYSTVATGKAAQDPRQALQWMESISNPVQRQQALTRIVMVWQASNPDDARTWVGGLPPGNDRDDATVAIMANQPALQPASQQLIASIGNAAKRKQATMSYVARLAQSDVDEAERVLAGMELSDAERLRYQQMLENIQYNSFMID